MGCRARATFENRYSPEKNYSLLMDIYDRVIAGHRGQAYDSRPTPNVISATVCVE